MPLPRSARRRLGTLLIAEGVVNEEQLKYALDEQKRLGKPLGMIFVDLGYLSEETLAKTLAEQLQVPYIDPTIYTIDTNLIKMVPADLMHRYQFVPLDKFGDMVIIAAAGMPDERVASFFKDVLNCDVMLYITTYTAIRNMLQKYAPVSKEQEVEISEKRKEDADRISERLEMESSGKLPKVEAGKEEIEEVTVEEVDSKKAVAEKVPIPPPPSFFGVSSPPKPQPPKEVAVPPQIVVKPPPKIEIPPPPPMPPPPKSQPAPVMEEEERTEEFSISGVENGNDIDWQSLFDDIDKKVREEVKKRRDRGSKGRM